MKVRSMSWLLRTCGALVLVAAVAAAAEARSTGGYSAFRPFQTYAAQDCVTEYWGSALNLCSVNLGLLFEAVIDTAGWHNITAVSIGNGPPFQCYAQSIDQYGPQHINGTPQAFTNTGGETLTFAVFVPGGWTLRLICDGVPVGRGIFSLNWNP